MVCFKPVFGEILVFEPSLLLLEISNNFLGLPSGIVESNANFPSYPTSATINSANSFMETSVPHHMH
jgi:hypothetical protein